MRLTPQVDTQMCSINCPIEGEARHVREYDIDVVNGKVLLATANYNLADDETSCVEGQVREMYPTLNLPALSIRTGENIRFARMTGFENIAYGELIAPIEDPTREAEMMTANMVGCFTTLRCTFAQGNEPDVDQTSVPDSTPIDLIPAKRERDKPDAADVKPLTRGQIGRHPGRQ